MNQQLNELKESFPDANQSVLSRFLTARKNNVEQTKQMYKRHLQWRNEFQIDQIELFGSQFVELSAVCEALPHGFAYGKDKGGSFLYIFKLGDLSLQQLFSVTSEQRLILHIVRQLELTKEAGILAIIDLKGSNMKIFSKQIISFINLLISLLCDNYPELLKKLFIINAPMMFQQVWTLIKGQIDERTKSKIVITGQEFKEQLLHYIDVQNLPEFFGGLDKRGIQSTITADQYEDEYIDEENDDEDENNNALELLKNALSGISLAHPQIKAPHNPEKYQLTTNNHLPPSDTPLNTEAEEDPQGGLQYQQEME